MKKEHSESQLVDTQLRMFVFLQIQDTHQQTIFTAQSAEVSLEAASPPYQTKDIHSIIAEQATGASVVTYLSR